MKRKLMFYLMPFVLCLMPLVGGCEEGLTGEQIKLFTGQMQQLSAKVDDFQKTSNETIKQLETSGLISKETIDKVEKVNSEIDKVQDQQADIAKAINEVQYGDDGIVNLIKAAQAGNTASAPWNPYAAPIAGILAIAEAVTLAFLRKKSGEADENANMRDKIITSVDGLLDSTVVSDAEKAKEILKKYQGNSVSTAVKKLKAN